MELETRGEKAQWGFRDQLGFVGQFMPGEGGRIEAAGEFPTGPAIGERLPDIVAPDRTGRMVDVHAERGDQPVTVVFYRSAVW